MYVFVWTYPGLTSESAPTLQTRIFSDVNEAVSHYNDIVSYVKNRNYKTDNMMLIGPSGIIKKFQSDVDYQD